MTWWGDKIDEINAQQAPALPELTIPQESPAAEDTSITSLVEQARANTARPDPAVGVLSTPKTLTGGRQAMTPGADVSQVARRPGPAAAAEPTMLDLTPQQRAELIRLGTAAGRFEENGTAKAAKDHAAMVAEATRQGAWTTDEDTTPGRWVNPKGVAGYTTGHGGER